MPGEGPAGLVSSVASPLGCKWTWSLGLTSLFLCLDAQGERDGESSVSSPVSLQGDRCCWTRAPRLWSHFTASFKALLPDIVTLRIKASTYELEREESVQSITPLHVDIWCEELTHWKDPDAGKDWGQEEKRTREDEMVGWHHQLHGHEFEQLRELVMDQKA